MDLFGSSDESDGDYVEDEELFYSLESPSEEIEEGNLGGQEMFGNELGDHMEDNFMEAGLQEDVEEPGDNRELNGEDETNVCNRIYNTSMISFQNRVNLITNESTIWVRTICTHIYS